MVDKLKITSLETCDKIGFRALREIAKVKKIAGYERLTKGELCKALIENKFLHITDLDIKECSQAFGKDEIKSLAQSLGIDVGQGTKKEICTKIIERQKAEGEILVNRFEDSSPKDGEEANTNEILRRLKMIEVAVEQGLIQDTVKTNTKSYYDNVSRIGGKTAGMLYRFQKGGYLNTCPSFCKEQLGTEGIDRISEAVRKVRVELDTHWIKRYRQWKVEELTDHVRLAIYEMTFFVDRCNLENLPHTWMDPITQQERVLEDELFDILDKFKTVTQNYCDYIHRWSSGTDERNLETEKLILKTSDTIRLWAYYLGKDCQSGMIERGKTSIHRLGRQVANMFKLTSIPWTQTLLTLAGFWAAYKFLDALNMITSRFPEGQNPLTNPERYPEYDLPTRIIGRLLYEPLSMCYALLGGIAKTVIKNKYGSSSWEIVKFATNVFTLGGLLVDALKLSSILVWGGGFIYSLYNILSKTWNIDTDIILAMDEDYKRLMKKVEKPKRRHGKFELCHDVISQSRFEKYTNQITSAFVKAHNVALLERKERSDVKSVSGVYLQGGSKVYPKDGEEHDVWVVMGYRDKPLISNDDDDDENDILIHKYLGKKYILARSCDYACYVDHEKKYSAAAKPNYAVVKKVNCASRLPMSIFNKFVRETPKYYETDENVTILTYGEDIISTEITNIQFTFTGGSQVTINNSEEHHDPETVWIVLGYRGDDILLRKEKGKKYKLISSQNISCANLFET